MREEKSYNKFLIPILQIYIQFVCKITWGQSFYKNRIQKIWSKSDKPLGRTSGNDTVIIKKCSLKI
jgi:hypothetical protein